MAVLEHNQGAALQQQQQVVQRLQAVAGSAATQVVEMVVLCTDGSCQRGSRVPLKQQHQQAIVQHLPCSCRGRYSPAGALTSGCGRPQACICTSIGAK
jgi:hypothetical protein